MVVVIHQRCLRGLTTHLQRLSLLHRVRFIHCSSSQLGDKTNKVSRAGGDSISVFDRFHKDEPKALTPIQKVAENTKTSLNLFVIIGGAGFIGFLLYNVLSEFFSKVSPSTVFKMAMKKIEADERCQAVLGDKIKGFGDPNSRTRKRLEHQPYEAAGEDYLRVVFHIEGTKRTGSVSCDLKKTKNGWKTRFIILNLDGFPPGKITIEDNRLEVDSEDLPDIDYSEFMDLDEDDESSKR